LTYFYNLLSDGFGEGIVSVDQAEAGTVAISAGTLGAHSSPPAKHAPQVRTMDRHLVQVKEDVMTQPTEKQIKNRAYEIWERNGRPEGKEGEFWQLAEQELRNEDKSSPVRTPDDL
jgi:hypothetical protein